MADDFYTASLDEDTRGIMPLFPVRDLNPAFEVRLTQANLRRQVYFLRSLDAIIADDREACARYGFHPEGYYGA